MRIGLDQLTETPLRLAFEASPEWWREQGRADAEMLSALSEPFHVELDACRMGPNVFLEGEASGVLELACSRCVTRYREPIRERFRLLLEPAGSRVPADPEAAECLDREGMVLREELETGWFRGNEIQLDRFVQEVIALVFPVQPLCREDCRGLCPRCGVDRNLENCDCQEVRPDSPFAVLAKLREGPGGTQPPAGGPSSEGEAE